jgi:hypothetical protein
LNNDSNTSTCPALQMMTIAVYSIANDLLLSQSVVNFYQVNILVVRG